MSEINTVPIHATQTFVAACRHFFGLRPGNSLQDFAAELKVLTPQDKQDLIAEFRTIGIDASKTS